MTTLEKDAENTQTIEESTSILWGIDFPTFIGFSQPTKYSVDIADNDKDKTQLRHIYAGFDSFIEILLQSDKMLRNKLI